MSKSSYWIRSGSYVFLQRLAIFIFGFGSYFFLVRYFSKDEFGVWALFTVITSAVEMSRSAFVQNAFVKFYSQADVDRDSLITASSFLNLMSVIVIMGVLVALLPILTEFWHSAEIANLLLWYCVTSLILVPFTQINYIEQASNSFRGIFWSAVVRQGLFFAVVIVIFAFIPGMSLTFFAALQALCALAGLLVAIRFSGDFMPKSMKMHWPTTKRLFGFGKYVLGTGITSSIGKSTDQILLGSLSHSTVALYNAAVRVMNFIEIPTYSISNVVYPKIAERVNQEGKYAARDMYEKSVAYMIAIVFPMVVVIALVPQFVLFVTAGRAYMEAASVLQLIILSAILFPFNVQVGTAFEVIGKPQVSFAINLTSNLLNFVLNLVLIYKIGILGAALTTMLTYLSIFIVSQFLLGRELGVSVLRILRQLPDTYTFAFTEIMAKLRKKKGEN